MVGAFIGGRLNRLRRPRPDLVPLALFETVLTAPPPLVLVAFNDPLPFLPLYLVLRVLFLSLALRSSVRDVVEVVAAAGAVSDSLFTFLQFFSKQSLHKCWFSPAGFHRKDSVHLHCKHVGDGIFKNYFDLSFASSEYLIRSFDYVLQMKTNVFIVAVRTRHLSNVKCQSIVNRSTSCLRWKH